MRGGGYDCGVPIFLVVGVGMEGTADPFGVVAVGTAVVDAVLVGVIVVASAAAVVVASAVVVSLLSSIRDEDDPPDD